MKILVDLFPALVLNEDKFYLQLKEIADANPVHSRVHRDHGCLQFETSTHTFLIEGPLTKEGTPKFVGIVEYLKDGREVSYETPEFHFAYNALEALSLELTNGVVRSNVGIIDG